MTRLRHSSDGYRRLLQMSSASLFILVEGPSDVYFYSRIAAAAGLKVRVEIRMARELPGATGGKRALLDYYEYLRRSDKLCSELAGKKTAVAFVVDKDVDDLLRCQRRSPHVVYTEHYSRENYLFAHGAVPDALAAILEVTAEQVNAALPAGWREAAAKTWREWIILCVLTRIVNINAESNFGVASRLNSPCAGTTDETAFEARLDAIRESAQMDSTAFAALRRRVTRLVDARISAGLHDTVFAGKWYVSFLRHWLAGVGTRTWSDRELESALLASLDYSSDWSRGLRHRFLAVVQRCQLPLAA